MESNTHQIGQISAAACLASLSERRPCKNPLCRKLVVRGTENGRYCTDRCANAFRAKRARLRRQALQIRGRWLKESWDSRETVLGRIAEFIDRRHERGQICSHQSLMTLAVYEQRLDEEAYCDPKLNIWEDLNAVLGKQPESEVAERLREICREYETPTNRAFAVLTLIDYQRALGRQQVIDWPGLADEDRERLKEVAKFQPLAGGEPGGEMVKSTRAAKPAKAPKAAKKSWRRQPPPKRRKIERILTEEEKQARQDRQEKMEEKMEKAKAEAAAKFEAWKESQRNPTVESRQAEVEEWERQRGQVEV
jgi:hypothetical protein